MSGSSAPKGKFARSSDDWYVSYADMITLILCFFIVIASVSTVNQAKVESVIESISKDVLKEKAQETPFKAVEDKMQTLITQKNLDKQVSVSPDLMGLKINFSSQVLFDSGSSDLKPDIKPILGEITKIIQSLAYKNYDILVEGHTDDQPIHTERFPSNWELSAGRATEVVRLLILLGIPKENLKAVGLSDARPLKPNRNANNIAIPENQAVNRRVVMLVQRKA